MAKKTWFNWQLPIYAAVGTLIVFLLVVISSAVVGKILFQLVAVPIVSLVLIILAILKKGRQRLSVISTLVVFWAVCAPLLANYFAVRDETRWLFWSTGYKAQVLAQPDSAIGELRHVEWDGWGFAGNDTTAYLVFDPDDSLAAEAKSLSPRKVSGIPCEVQEVRRLESHWYAVKFYTETDWDHCN